MHEMASNRDSHSDAGLIQYPQFILFGDSITQFSSLTLQARLQDQYIRRLDVLNRGLSGFTAPMGFVALQKFLPASTPKSSWPKIRIATIFFGANDACVPGQSQHVELTDYIDALQKMVAYPVFDHSPKELTEIIVITPPPVNEHQFERMPDGHFQRRAGITSQYARAARETGKAAGVHILDFWTVIMSRVGWSSSMGIECCCDHIPSHFDAPDGVSRPTEQHIPGCCHAPTDIPNAKNQLSDFLRDGLHLTNSGYDVLYGELMKLIQQRLPHLIPDNIPMVLPAWRDALQLAEYNTTSTNKL